MTITARATTRKLPKAPKPNKPAVEMTAEVAVDLLAQTVTALRVSIAAIEARATAAEAATAALRITVEDQTGLIRQLTNGSATTATALEALGARVTLVTETAAADIAAIETDFATAIARAETAVGELSTTIADTSRATAARVETLRSGLPKSLIIDHAGDLIATTHAGDTLAIGPVRGAPGRDAPRIADVIYSRGHLVHKMTDGTSFLVAMPEPVSPAVPVLPPATRTPAGDKVKDALRLGIIMDRQTDSFAAIGKKYGVSARVVARIIKEFKA